MKCKIIIVLFVINCSIPAYANPIIDVVNHSEREIKTKAVIESLLVKYDLGVFEFTNIVHIEEFVISHNQL